MQVTFDVPEELAARLQSGARDLSRRALEALVVDAFRLGQINSPAVQQALGFRSRLETVDFLGRHKVWPRYEAEDLREDVAALERLFPS